MNSAPSIQTRSAEPVTAPVCQALPAHLTAPEIAAELWLSVNTVNTHTRHLYAKLGVHSRREAVRRARGLGLLAPSARRGLRRNRSGYVRPARRAAEARTGAGAAGPGAR
jgi:hypothetical protein